MLKHGPKPFDPKLGGCFKIAPLFSTIWLIIFHFLLWAWPRDDEEKGFLSTHMAFQVV